MALYLNYPIELQKEKIVVAEWSNTDIPVLGVATNKKRITFFQDEGNNLSEHDLKKASTFAEIFSVFFKNSALLQESSYL